MRDGSRAAFAQARDPFLSSLCLRVVTGLVEKDVPPSPRPYSLLVSLNNVCCTNLIRVILLIRTDVSGKFDFAKRHIEVFFAKNNPQELQRFLSVIQSD